MHTFDTYKSRLRGSKEWYIWRPRSQQKIQSDTWSECTAVVTWKSTLKAHMKDAHGMWSDMYMERVQLLLERGHEKSHWKSTWGICMDCGVIQDGCNCYLKEHIERAHWKSTWRMRTDCGVIHGPGGTRSSYGDLAASCDDTRAWTLNNNWVLVMVMVLLMVMMVLMVICTIYTSSSSLPWCSSQLRCRALMERPDRCHVPSQETSGRKKSSPSSSPSLDF